MRFLFSSVIVSPPLNLFYVSPAGCTRTNALLRGFFSCFYVIRAPAACQRPVLGVPAKTFFDPHCGAMFAGVGALCDPAPLTSFIFDRMVHLLKWAE
jgi:hypothetical protein